MKNRLSKLLPVLLLSLSAGEFVQADFGYRLTPAEKEAESKLYFITIAPAAAALAVPVISIYGATCSSFALSSDKSWDEVCLSGLGKETILQAKSDATEYLASEGKFGLTPTLMSAFELIRQNENQSNLELATITLQTAMAFENNDSLNLNNNSAYQE